MKLLYRILLVVLSFLIPVFISFFTYWISGGEFARDSSILPFLAVGYILGGILCVFTTLVMVITYD